MSPKPNDTVKHPVNGRGKLIQIFHSLYAHCVWEKPPAGMPSRSTVNLAALERAE
jgi:hypothetical protein